MPPLSFFLQTVLLPTFMQVVPRVTPRHGKEMENLKHCFLLVQCLNLLKSETLTLLFLCFCSNRCLIHSPENNSAERVKCISSASSKPCFYVYRRNDSSVLPGTTPLRRKNYFLWMFKSLNWFLFHLNVNPLPLLQCVAAGWHRGRSNSLKWYNLDITTSWRELVGGKNTSQGWSLHKLQLLSVSATLKFVPVVSANQLLPEVKCQICPR